jgi:hypothetical protein
LKDLNQSLNDTLARTGPPTSSAERVTLEDKVLESSTHMLEINELRASRESDRALIAQLREELQVARSDSKPESGGTPISCSELSSEIQRALVSLVRRLVVRGGAWAARYAYHREYLAKEAYIRHLIKKSSVDTKCPCTTKLEDLLSDFDVDPAITRLDEVTKVLSQLCCGNIMLPAVADPPEPDEEEDWKVITEARTERDHQGVRRTAVIAHNCLDPHQETRDLLSRIWPGLVPDDPGPGQPSGSHHTQPDP